jgi:hypothetical protein
VDVYAILENRNSYEAALVTLKVYNKIVKNEFISVEDISSKDEGRLRYDMFVMAYNDKREHGGINGLTPSEMFLQTFNRLHKRNNTKQKSVTYVGI